MSKLINKVRHGNLEAMQELYEKNKKQVAYFCLNLNDNETEAENAYIFAFKNAFQSVMTGQITTEEDFADYIVKKTIATCKSRVSKKNSKAFRFPTNKNFAVVPLDIDKMKFVGNLTDVIINNLPPLHRFIYVIYISGIFTTEQICDIFHLTPNSLKIALDSIPVVVKHIAHLASKKMKMDVNYSSDNFQHDLEERKEKSGISEKAEQVVYAYMQKVCEPIINRKKQQNKKIFALIGIIVAAVALVCLITFLVTRSDNSSSSTATADTATASTADTSTYTPTALDESLTYYADIEIEDYGTITVQLDQESAPITCANFVELANSGFYDGLTFHRIIDGFMMQGGDPNGDGTGGSENNIVGEFSDNGYDNELSHTRGAVSMARSTDYDSASSQFFIVQEDSSSSLDGQYAVFGYVTEGMDIVDTICESAEPTDDNGSISSDEQPIITSITIRTE